MALYKATNNDFPDITLMAFPRKCKKVEHGSFFYTIDDDYKLTIDNGTKGTSKKVIELKPIIEGLVVGTWVKGAKKFLNPVFKSHNNNDAGFICAVLRDLQNIQIHK